MPGFLAQLKALNENLTLNQKLAIGALGLVVLFGILGVVYYFNGVEYQPLATHMDAESVQLTIERLKEKNISYKLADAGQTVLVPSTSLDQARLELAASGVAFSRNDPGFEIFDQGNGWNVTKFGEEVKYKRATEGRLARTLEDAYRSIVRNVKVHIVFEKESLYKQDEQPATASVSINLNRGRTFPGRNVDAVRNFVSSAVPGLSPENVQVVVDGKLREHRDEDDTLLKDRQILLRNRLEQEVTAKVMALLDKTVGPGKSQVQTTLTLDFKALQQKQMLKEPVILSQEETQRPVPGADGVGGVPGVIANQGEGPQAADQAGAGVATSKVVNYEYSLTERLETIPGGAITKMKLGVVIDNRKVESTDSEGNPVLNSEPWDQEMLDKFKALVSSAVGLETERGDELTLTNIPFQLKSPLEEEPQGLFEKYREIIEPGLRWLGLIALFLLFYMMIFRPIKKRIFAYVEYKDPEFAQLMAGEAPQLQGSSADQLALTEGASSLGGAGAGAEDEEEEESAEDRVRSELVAYARQDPDRVSELVRDWLVS